MAIRSNGYFNNPQFAAAAGNLAALFEPPSGADAAGFATAKAKKEEASRLAQLFVQSQSPEFNQTQFDRGAVAAGIYNPSQSYYSVDLGDATTRRGQDVVASTSRSNNAADNARALQETKLKSLADFYDPLNEGQVRPALPADIAGMYGVDRALPAEQGRQKALTESEWNAGQRERLRASGQLTDQDLMDLITGEKAPVEAVGADGKPKYMSPGAAIREGAMPYDKPSGGLTVQTNPDGTTTVTQGGSGKGWGKRCVIVTAAGKVWMGTTATLAALVTSDERPDLAEVVRQMLGTYVPPKSAESTDYQARCSCADESGAARPEYGAYDFVPTEASRVACLRHSPPLKFPGWYQTLLDAVEGARLLEQAQETAAETADIEHYVTHPVDDWAAQLCGMRPAIQLPPGQSAPGGVDKVVGGVLLPGPCSMVLLSTAGGGKRYGHTDFRLVGVEEIARGGYDGRGYYSAHQSILAIVTDPTNWRIEWEERKDGVQVDAVSAGSDGIRHSDGSVTLWA